MAKSPKLENKAFEYKGLWIEQNSIYGTWVFAPVTKGKYANGDFDEVIHQCHSADQAIAWIDTFK